MTYRFGPFAADRTTYRVFRGDEVVELTPKLLDLLFYFLERPAMLVTKEALLDALWPGANVTDNALAQAISELRDALHDEPASPTFIRTIARRGYRFVAAVDAVEPAPRATPTADERSVGQPAVAAADGPPAIAVLDFSNVTGDADVAWLGAGIPETVTSDLAALDHFRVIDRWRVVQAARGTSGSVRELATALGARFVVTGSYQRSGLALRITARVVDLFSGEAVADAKVDGPIHDVFTLQDGIVSAFARELSLPAPVSGTRLGVRETSSLEAYRAYMEGLLKIESLDTTVVGASITDFKRSIAADPRYAIAYAGLANAELVAYEMTRLTRDPDRRSLASGMEHARRALQLDDRLAEAHSTLSFLLTSAGRFDEARAAAQRATALEPDSWRHQYRLGHASWGDSRLRAFERALAVYPQFPYAPLEMAMVHVARGHFDVAEHIVRRGGVDQDRQPETGDRFPAIGFHWLLGLLRAAQDDHQNAIAEFDRELAQVNPRRLYGPEYAAAALVARGHIELITNTPDRALASFRAAGAHLDGFVPAQLGLAAAFARQGQARDAAAAREDARSGIRALEASDRSHDAWLLAACDAALHDGADAAWPWLERLLEREPPSFIGWAIPIEPLLRPLCHHPEFKKALSRLAERAH